MRGFRSPRGRTLAALAVILFLAIVAERERWFGRLLGTASADVDWIWSAAPPRDIAPRAFYAARDFELAERPASARLEALGDAEYLVQINGERVGSGRYRSGAPFDAYEVAPLLRRGRNRVVLLLRSALGNGGAALRISDAAGRVLVASDGEWRVYSGARRELSSEAPLPAGGHATVLGRAPFGRWGSPASGPLRPRHDEVLAPGGALEAETFRRPGKDADWRPLRPRRRSSLGRRVEIDFGRQLFGYLHLDFDPRGPRTALVRFDGVAEPETTWHPDVFVVAVPQQSYWQDVEPRRFRYVEIVGLDRLFNVRAVPLRESARELAAPEGPLIGMLGFPVEPPRVPIEDEIWSRTLGAGAAR